MTTLGRWRQIRAIPADTLCQFSFCVARGLHTIIDPVTDELLAVCEDHFIWLRGMQAELERARRAAACQTWLGA